ncbi:MAG: hypothetical protein IK095_01860 [Oscillospiraceae bacterium]|nr:hypothetical protein [Oscillospiraceae bacterium]
MKRKIDPFWGILTIALVVLGFVLCGIGAKRGALVVKTDADPAETVETFFESVEIGKYEAAYACLDNYESLGLERSPHTEAGKLEWDALLSSYDYTLQGETQVKGDSAVQTVTLRFLDLNALEQALTDKLAPAPEPEGEEGAEGEDAAAEEPAGEEAAEPAEGEAQPVDPETVLAALRELLQDPKPFYRTDTLEIELRYADGQWRIVADPALLAALAGGRA